MRFDPEAAARPKSSDVKNFLNRDKNARAGAASKKYIRRMTKLGGLGGVAFGGVGGFAQQGSSGSYFMLPAYDLLLRMGDRNIKNRLIGGDLTYRITAGPNGTKIVHLYNVPGGRFDFGSIQNNRQKVWYWYYDTTSLDTCLDKNNGIVKLPSDVETEELKLQLAERYLTGSVLNEDR